MFTVQLGAGASAGDGTYGVPLLVGAGADFMVPAGAGVAGMVLAGAGVVGTVLVGAAGMVPVGVVTMVVDIMHTITTTEQIIPTTTEADLM